VQAAFLIAQQKKFRPKTVIGLDLDRKAKHLATVPGVPDQIAARALVTYHLAEQRPMMGAFLDALGIAHENGLIQEENVKPDTARNEERRRENIGRVPGGGRADLSQHPALSGSGNVGGLEETVKSFEESGLGARGLAASRRGLGPGASR
jgi:hypothetical protein